MDEGAEAHPLTDRIHVFWHEGMLKHETGRGVFDTGMDPGFLDVLEKHPENADRIRNMVSILKRGPISSFISWHEGKPAAVSELLSFHSQGFYRSNEVLTISLHMNHGSWGPSHPQNGSIDELGEGDGFGYNLNIPLPNGSGDRGYQYAMKGLVIPTLQKFQPSLMVLVVGQDSSAFDPNGRQCLSMDGYREIGQIIRGLADTFCEGRLLIVQEGGYHVTYAAYCLHSTLEGALNVQHPLLSDPLDTYPEDESFTVSAFDTMKQYFKKTVPFLNDLE
ncbi:hypothetical protein Ancab_007490 [Ancistrocladus abbreviatus]